MRMHACLAGLILVGTPAAWSAETAPVRPAAAPQGRPESAASEKRDKPELRVRHETNGDVVISLDLATQKLMGLQTAPVEAARLSPEMKGYGRVLEVSTLIAVVADLAPAQAARDASQAELDRLKTLAGQSNASQRALQAGEVAAARDQAQIDSARLRLLASWGAEIAGRPDLPGLTHSLGALESVLVQIDLPAGASVDAAPADARLLTLADETNPIPAKWIGPAPAVDPLNQGRGFLFLVSPNVAHLAPGQAVTGLLSLRGEAETGVALPREAVLRHRGASWVYLQTGDTLFQRKAVILGRPLAQSWFVPGSLKAGEKVVVTGAQQLLSEELKGADEGGD